MPVLGEIEEKYKICDGLTLRNTAFVFSILLLKIIVFYCLIISYYYQLPPIRFVSIIVKNLL